MTESRQGSLRTGEPGSFGESGRPRGALHTGQERLDIARTDFAIRLAALHDLSLELSLLDDVDEICQSAVRLGQPILGWDRIGIWFADPGDAAFLHGSFGVDEAGQIRDERGLSCRRSEQTLPEGFYEGKEPVYHIGKGPCFNECHEIIGESERAIALLWDGRKVLGEIWVDNLLTERPIDGGSLEILVRFARIVGSLCTLKRVQAELMFLLATDSLTGIVNRRTVLVILEKLVRLAARTGGDLAIIYCDLDRLKDVNDSLGHAAGDEYIKQACTILLEALRDSDTVGRLGGDEFLIVLPNCGAEGARRVNARIEASMARANAGENPFWISISKGIATYSELGPAKDELTGQDLIAMADARMYMQKRERRAARDAV